MEQNPNAHSCEINRDLGANWAALSKKEKKSYTKKAKIDKKRVTNHLKVFEEKTGLKLKKPICAYALFLKDNINEMKLKFPNMHYFE